MKIIWAAIKKINLPTLWILGWILFAYWCPHSEPEPLEATIAIISIALFLVAMIAAGGKK